MNTSALCSFNATFRVNGVAAGVAGWFIASYRELASGMFSKRPR